MLWFKKESTIPITIEEAKKTFQKQLKIIGWLPLSEDVSIEDIKATRKELRAAYQEVKKRNLNMGFIDFFCWISTREILTVTKKHDSVEQLYEMLVYLIDCDSTDARNMLRLFRVNHSYFLDELQIRDPAEKRDLFMKLNGLWYDTIQRESI